MSKIATDGNVTASAKNVKQVEIKNYESPFGLAPAKEKAKSIAMKENLVTNL